MHMRISIREANQHLSRYLEDVERGDEVVITRRGKPIAKLVRVGEPGELSQEQVRARERLRRKLSVGFSLGGQRFDRDSVYDRST